MKSTLIQIGILAVLVRLAFFAQLPNEPRFDKPFSDMLIYHNWASYWGVDGEAYPWEPSGEPFWRSPGYPLFLSVIYKVVGDNVITGPRTAAFIQMILGIAATLAVAAFVFRRWGRTAAWSSALLTTLHAPLIFMEAVILPVGLATPFLTFTGLAVLRLLEGGKEDRRLATGAGLLAGINAVIRPNLGLVIPFVCFVLWRRKPGRANTWWVAGAAALPLLATTGWNLARSGDFTVTGANGPMNLFFAYGDDGGPTFDTKDPVWGNPERQVQIARSKAAEELGVPLEQVGRKEASSHWGDKAKTWIAENPGPALVMAWEKVLGVVTWRDLAVMVPLSASNESILILNLLLVPFPLLLLLALFGALRRRGAATIAILLGFVPILVSAVLFFTYTRFRVPAVPLLGLAAGPGLVALVEWIRSFARKGAAPETPGTSDSAAAERPGVSKLAGSLFLVAAAILVWVSWTPWTRAEAIRDKYWKTSEARGWNDKGVGYFERYVRLLSAGQPDAKLLGKAVQMFEKAIEVQPITPLPQTWIAKIERDHRGNGAKAYGIFSTLYENYPAFVYPEAAAELAVCEVRGLGPGGRPNYQRAAKLFREVEDNRGMQSKFRESYAEALYNTGRKEEACAQLKRLVDSGILQGNPTWKEEIAARQAEWNCPN